jgi:hypothetical protein
MISTPDAASPAQFFVGTPVEVFISYSHTWASGYEIASAHGGSYTLRRVSDWAVLPGSFTGYHLRPRRPLDA